MLLSVHLRGRPENGERIGERMEGEFMSGVELGSVRAVRIERDGEAQRALRMRHGCVERYDTQGLCTTERYAEPCYLTGVHWCCSRAGTNDGPDTNGTTEQELGTNQKRAPRKARDISIRHLAIISKCR